MVIGLVAAPPHVPPSAVLGCLFVAARASMFQARAFSLKNEDVRFVRLQHEGVSLKGFVPVTPIFRLHFRTKAASPVRTKFRAEKRTRKSCQVGHGLGLKAPGDNRPRPGQKPKGGPKAKARPGARAASGNPHLRVERVSRPKCFKFNKSERYGQPVVCDFARAVVHLKSSRIE